METNKYNLPRTVILPLDDTIFTIGTRRFRIAYHHIAQTLHKVVLDELKANLEDLPQHLKHGTNHDYYIRLHQQEINATEKNLKVLGKYYQITATLPHYEDRNIETNKKRIKHQVVAPEDTEFISYQISELWLKPEYKALAQADIKEKQQLIGTRIGGVRLRNLTYEVMQIEFYNFLSRTAYLCEEDYYFSYVNPVL